MTDHYKCESEQQQQQPAVLTSSTVGTSNQTAQNLNDPKNVQELTSFVQITLQQMQEKFQIMSDQIVNRNILFKC